MLIQTLSIWTSEGSQHHWSPQAVYSRTFSSSNGAAINPGYPKYFINSQPCVSYRVCGNKRKIAADDHAYYIAWRVVLCPGNRVSELNTGSSCYYHGKQFDMMQCSLPISSLRFQQAYPQTNNVACCSHLEKDSYWSP